MLAMEPHGKLCGVSVKAWKVTEHNNALLAGIAKLDGYYDKTSSSDADTFAICEDRYFLRIIISSHHFNV